MTSPSTTIMINREDFDAHASDPSKFESYLRSRGKPPTFPYTTNGRRVTWGPPAPTDDAPTDEDLGVDTPTAPAPTGSSSSATADEDDKPLPLTDIDFTKFNKTQLRDWIFQQTSTRPPRFHKKDTLIATAVQIQNDG
jgi:hypothetical protein